MTQRNTTTTTITSPNRRSRRHNEAGSVRTQILVGVAAIGLAGIVGAALLLGGGSDSSANDSDSTHRRDRDVHRVASPASTKGADETSTASTVNVESSSSNGSNGSNGSSRSESDSGSSTPARPDVRDDLGDPPGASSTSPAGGTAIPGGYTVEPICCLAPGTPGVVTTIPPGVGLHVTLPPDVMRSLLPGAGMLPTPMVTLPPLGH